MIYQIIEDHDLIVGYGTGTITTDEIVDGLNKVSFQPGFRAGLDRCVFFDDGASLIDLNFDGLKKIQDMARKGEQSGSHGDENNNAKGYKLACVSTNEIKIVLLKLYQAPWPNDPIVGVDVKLFSNKEDALTWLGRPNLSISDHPGVNV